MCRSVAIVRPIALPSSHTRIGRIVGVTASGLGVALVGLTAFGLAHALIIVPIWTRLLGGVPFAVGAGLALAWAFDELARHRGSQSIASGVQFGAVMFLTLIPATALEAAMRWFGPADSRLGRSDPGRGARAAVRRGRRLVPDETSRHIDRVRRRGAGAHVRECRSVARRSVHSRRVALARHRAHLPRRGRRARNAARAPRYAKRGDGVPAKRVRPSTGSGRPERSSTQRVEGRGTGAPGLNKDCL